MDEKSLMEAALFSAGRPVGEQQLKSLLNRSSTYINSLAQKLIEEYRQRNSPLEIVKLDGKYALQLRPEYAERVGGLFAGRAPGPRAAHVIRYRLLPANPAVRPGGHPGPGCL